MAMLSSFRLLFASLVILGLTLEVASKKKPSHKSSNGGSSDGSSYNTSALETTTLPNQPELTTTDEPESTTEADGGSVTTTPIPGPPPPTPPPTSPPPTFPPTDPNNIFFTTAGASTRQGQSQSYDPAFCTVEFYEPSSWDTDEGCSGTESHTEVLQSSVGFTSQYCNIFEPVHTVGTTLYMTIQPICKRDPNDPNEALRWNICSWRPHFQSDQIICTSLGLDCCEYLDQSIIGPQTVEGQSIDNADLACQEYEEDVCYPVFGRDLRDSTPSISQYALRLVNCTGNLNPNPQCQASNLLEQKDPSWIAKFGKVHWMTVTGIGLILVAGLLAHRRHAQKQYQLNADEFIALLGVDAILDGPTDGYGVNEEKVDEVVEEVAPVLA